MALKLFLFFSFISSFSFSQTKNIILWKDSLTLNLKDFKVKRITDTTILAGISTSFSLNEEEKRKTFKLDVIAKSDSKKNYFNKTYIKSKTRTELTDKEIIRHENYHFNITEMYCRYIEQEFYYFVKKKPRSIKRIHSKLSKLYWRYLSDWDAYEDNFDICTQHGNDIQEHEKWIAEINSELENLKQFENVTIKLIKQKKKYVLVGLIENTESPPR